MPDKRNKQRVEKCTWISRGYHHWIGKPPGPIAFHFHTLTRPCSSPENTSCAVADPAMARALFTSPSVPRASKLGSSHIRMQRSPL